MSKGKKIFIAIFTVIAVITIGVVVMLTNVSGNLKDYTDYDFSGLDLSTVEDGTYSGSEDAQIIKVTAEVTVKDHTIIDIKLLQHVNGKGEPAEVIVGDIVANNSLEVDAISGATYSSQVIKVAVYNALKNR